MMASATNTLSNSEEGQPTEANRPRRAETRHSCWLPKTMWIALALAVTTVFHWLGIHEELSPYISTSVASGTSSLSSVMATITAGGSNNNKDDDLAAATTAANKNELLPDWRLTTQCSANTQDCVLRYLNRYTYAEYPFRVAPQFDSLYEWQAELPKGWLQSLREHAPLFVVGNGTTVVKQQQQQPTTGVDSDAVQACVSRALHLSVDDQLDALLKTLGRQVDMVSFTISDYLYTKDMMQDVFEMAHNIVGFKDAFFMVAMDVATMELACQHGYPFLAWPQEESKEHQGEGSNEVGALKKNVASTKFVISYELAKRRQSFFFFEMDVWFVKSPIPTLQEHDEDIVFSGHQNNPEAANIGVYAVKANAASEEYLRICIEIMEQSPDTHDQAIMQQVYVFLDALNDGRPLEYKRGGAFFEHEPLPAIPTFTHRATHGRLLPYQIATDERPVVVEDTLAIHTLCSAPLRNPHGKKMVAKDLGAWYGSGSYYYAKENRYLWLDGHAWNGVATAMSWPGFGPWEWYHRVNNIQWVVAATLALAKRTKRIWVMPKFLVDDGVYFIWSFLDMESVEALGVDYRETNFPANPKAWHKTSIPFGPVARTAVGPGGKIFVQPKADSASSAGDIFAWNSSAYRGESRSSTFDAWFAIHTTIPEVVDAQVLLAGLPATRGELEDLQHRLRTNVTLNIAEAEIVQVWKQLRWCPFEIPRPPDAASRSRADTDCYLKGQPFEHS